MGAHLAIFTSASGLFYCRIFNMDFLKGQYIKYALAISGVAAILSITYFSLKKVSHLLVIRFTGGVGIDLLGTKIDVYEVLLLGLIILLTNIFLIKIFYNRIRFISYLMAFFNILFSTLLLIGISVIISVN
jgi:hypothetical protein